VLGGREKHPTNAVHFNVVGERTGLGILGNESECSSKFLLEEARSSRAIAPPPSRFLANLIRRERRGFY